MESVIIKALVTILPLFGSAILHMVCVKLDILKFLKKPVHRKLFGENKTWRGFVLMPLLAIPFTQLAQNIDMGLAPELQVGFDNVSGLWFGILLGLAYVVGELPNSCIKRRMGVAPGKTSDKNKLFFIFMDQTDSAFTCLLMAYIFLDISFVQIIWTYLISVVVHLTFNYLLYILKIRKNPL